MSFGDDNLNPIGIKREINKPKEKEIGVINNLHTLSPFLDRVIVLKDPEESKYACKNCKGRGYTDETCDHCLGTGKEPRKRKTDEEELCRECIIKGEVDRAYGKVVCSICKGKKGIIVKPENTRTKPLTGKVLATGPDCKTAKQNMRVMFTNYTGIDFVIDGVDLMYCSEKDIIGEYNQLIDKDQKGTTDQIQEKTHEELAELGVDSGGKFIGN